MSKIIRSNRRTLALIIESDGSLTIRAPYNMSQKAIERFVEEKDAWIRSQREKILLKSPIAHSFEEGEEFLYLGEKYPLRLVARQISPLRFEAAFYLNYEHKKVARQVFTLWYKRQARIIFSERLADLAARSGYAYEKLRISSARSRWGSCSSRKTISLAWRLLMAPMDVIDYVIIHELVHLEFPNHSREFWERTASLCPLYITHREWLKNNGSQLVI